MMVCISVSLVLLAGSLAAAAPLPAATREGLSAAIPAGRTSTKQTTFDPPASAPPASAPSLSVPPTSAPPPSVPTTAPRGDSSSLLLPKTSRSFRIPKTFKTVMQRAVAPDNTLKVTLKRPKKNQSPLYVINLPSTSHFYSKPMTYNTSIGHKVPLKIISNGQPTSVYHWTPPTRPSWQHPGHWETLADSRHRFFSKLHQFRMSAPESRNLPMSFQPPGPSLSDTLELPFIGDTDGEAAVELASLRPPVKFSRKKLDLQTHILPEMAEPSNFLAGVSERD